MTDHTISPALARRLPCYFRTLIRLYGNGKEIVSSEELARELGLVPSQVRTDMKAIGCSGQRSYGYGIPALYKRIADILQLSDKFRAVLVGNTHLSHHIAESPIFTKRGIKLCAVFSEEKAGWEMLPECSVYPESELTALLPAIDPDIVILSGRVDSAAEVLDILSSVNERCGHAPEVWNFTDEDLFSETFTVKNIHLSDLLMMLCLEAGH